VKRILILSKGLGRGGAEQIVATAARHVDRERFDYEVAYLLPWKDALVKEIEDAGLPVRCLDGTEGLRWVPRLRRLVKARRIDLIHAHSPVAAIGARVALAGPRRPRRVYTEHNLWQRYHPATYWGNVLTFPYNDHVFAVSDHVRDSIGYPPGLGWRRMPPMETLFHGIDQEAVSRWATRDGVREELGIPPSAPVVGTVANLKVHKRLDRMIAAAIQVRRRVPDVRFVIVGTGPREAELRERALGSGLGGTVMFTGFREDAQRVASAFDVFALSSEYEGLSIALIEALALGKPAVVTDVGGLAEVVTDGVEGFRVPSDDPQALAEALERLLADPSLRVAMGERGVARARDFDIRNAIARMEAVYEELLT
jgi:glycosyltransferase involved in cell wall biosynthesis